MIEHLKLQHYQKMLWKNGLGFTYEIARSPQDDVDDFDWRISMADVDTDSEFSFFKDKQRIISVLSGTGMHLSLKQNMLAEPNEVHVLSRTLFAFDGEQSVYCRLLNGPIRDLNLIYRKDRVRPRVQWLKGEAVQTILSSAPMLFIFNMAEAAVIEIAQKKYHLAALDCLKISNADQMLTIQLPDHSEKDCCFIELYSIFDELL